MRFFAVVAKDLTILLKDTGAVVTLFLLPLMFIVVMSFALAPLFRAPGDRPLVVPVEDRDRGPRAQRVLERLREVPRVQVELVPDAEAEVLSGRRAAGLVLLAGFEQSGELLLIGGPAQAQLAVAIDGLVAGVLDGLDREERVIRETEGLARELQPEGAEAVDVRRLVAQAQERAQASGPGLKIRRKVSGSNELLPGIYEQNVPGYAVMFAFFLVNYVAGSILMERRLGTLQRLRAAPISRAGLLAGKLVPHFLVGLLQIAIMFTVGRLAFGMKLGHAPLGLALVTVAVSATATALGMLVASLARTEQQISGLSTLVILLLAALGGCLVPLFAMPAFMQRAALFTPHAWAMTAYQDLLVRGHGAADVLPHVGALLAFAAAFFAVALWRFRFDERP